jgi:glutathione synthase/RimK-type ligase-like ATP-grasp enzyme
VTVHPDSGRPLSGWKIPCWPAVRDLALRVSRVLGLGYVGVDIVVDEKTGPLVLEANARPGLGIQIANRSGLLKNVRL